MLLGVFFKVKNQLCSMIAWNNTTRELQVSEVPLADGQAVSSRTIMTGAATDFITEGDDLRFTGGKKTYKFTFLFSSVDPRSRRGGLCSEP